jgi:hypothetical protein
MIKRRKVAAANRAAPSPDSTDDYSPTKFNQLSPDKQQTYLISLLENSTSYTRSAVYRHLQAELRCDIISRLPGELRTLILQHLPAKTLSQLPSVSSQWRRSIDADAQLWRSLIVAEGNFTIQNWYTN